MEGIKVLGAEQVKFSDRHARQSGTVFMVKRDDEALAFEVFIPKKEATEQDLEEYLKGQ